MPIFSRETEDPSRCPSLQHAPAAALPRHREARLGRHGGGLSRRERRARGVQEAGRDQARSAAPLREEEVHLDVPRRGAPVGAPLAFELRPGVRHRRRRQRLLHRHGVRRRRRPQGRPRDAEEAGPRDSASKRRSSSRSRSAKGSATPTSSRSRAGAPRTSSIATSRRPTCSSPSTAR